MYIEPDLIPHLYGCFRCGAVNGDVKEDEMGHQCCAECGEQGLLTFQQALDLLNDYHLKGMPVLSDEHQYEIIELEFIPDDDTE